MEGIIETTSLQNHALMQKQFIQHEGRTAEILKVMIEEGWLKNLCLEQKHVDTIIRMITSPPRFEEVK